MTINTEKFQVHGLVPDYTMILRDADGVEVGKVVWEDGKASFRGNISQTTAVMMEALKPLIADDFNRR